MTKFAGVPARDFSEEELHELKRAIDIFQQELTKALMTSFNMPTTHTKSPYSMRQLIAKRAADTVDFLKHAPNKQATTREVADGTGTSLSVAYTVLDSLKGKGQVRLLGLRGYTNLYELVETAQ